MPSKTPSRKRCRPVMSYADATTTRLLRMVLFEPQSHMLLAGAYGTPYGFAAWVFRYFSAPATTEARTSLRLGSLLGTRARSSRPATAVLAQSKAVAPKMSAVCTGEASTASAYFFSPVL